MWLINNKGEIMDAAAVLQETIAAVDRTGISSRKYNGIIIKATDKLAKATGQQLAQERKKKLGAPSRYTEKVGNLICQRISEGETLREICKSLDLSFHGVMDWIEKHESFGENYRRSRQRMAVNMVEGMVENVRNLENDRALAARVQADVIRWTAQRFAPELFSDVKRVELKGEVTHRHTHELAHEQKQRIAEAWLLSQSDKADTPGITGITTGPAKEPALIEVDSLESAGVREICGDEQRVIPKRKRTASPEKPAIKGKPGRKRKPIVDQLAD